MKKIEAIIQPSKLDVVKQALNELGVRGLTVWHVEGFGRQKGHTEVYRGAEYMVNFTPKTCVEVAVDDDVAAQVLDAIATAARTGNIGDGKIFVMPLDDAVRIRTGESGRDAL